MVRDTVTECYRTLQLAPEDQGNFKSTVIKGIESHQTYHRDLHDLSKKDVEDFAIDFFFDETNLSFWWPQWPEDQRRMWWSTNQTQLEQALITLFDYWIEHERKVSRKKDSPNLNSLQSKIKKPRTGAGRLSGHFRRRSEPEASTEEPLRQRLDSNSSHHRPLVTPVDDTEDVGPTPVTPSITNSSLTDVRDDLAREVEPGDEDSDGLPSVSAILRGYMQPRPRQESRTIEPQSPPLSNHKAKAPVHEQDSTYVESQTSTIGQPPISPPTTRHREQRKRRLDEGLTEVERNDMTEISPLAKRGRPNGGVISLQEAHSDQDASSEDEENSLLSETLREAVVQSPSEAAAEDDDPAFDIATENVVNGEDTAKAEELGTQQESQDQFDAFEELSKLLNRYLRECRDDTLKRANDSALSRRESRKLHIKSGLLHHLYGDVLSRIRAVNAQRNGGDESNKISFHTLHS